MIWGGPVHGRKVQMAMSASWGWKGSTQTIIFGTQIEPTTKFVKPEGPFGNVPHTLNTP